MKRFPVLAWALVGVSITAQERLSHAFEQPKFWSNRVPLIDKKLQEAVAHYSKNDIKSAKRTCDDAYFGIFEENTANMEIAIRQHLSASLSSDLETRFGEIRKGFVQQKPIDAIHADIDSLKKDLIAAANDLDKSKVSP